jgi:hypothetical protein
MFPRASVKHVLGPKRQASGGTGHLTASYGLATVELDAEVADGRARNRSGHDTASADSYGLRSIAHSSQGSC